MASDHFRTLFDWLQSLYKALTSEIVSRENDIDAGKLKAETRITGPNGRILSQVQLIPDLSEKRLPPAGSTPKTRAYLEPSCQLHLVAQASYSADSMQMT